MLVSEHLHIKAACPWCQRRPAKASYQGGGLYRADCCGGKVTTHLQALEVGVRLVGHPTPQCRFCDRPSEASLFAGVGVRGTSGGPYVGVCAEHAGSCSECDYEATTLVRPKGAAVPVRYCDPHAELATRSR